jgi:(1->4)-alpha-D-glucan 1-alpha-D-glucosylmutase
VRRWQNLNRDLKTIIEDSAAPDENEEYLLYQTLIGAWPFAVEDGESRQSFVNRIQEYLIKAVREAKIHSSWLNPDEEYERAVRDFVERLLAAESPFISEFAEFQAPIARAGMFNSLSQTLLKIAAPGVPDFYQGTELWDFSLVDPDNRRAVDYERRKQLLAELRASEGEMAALARDLMRSAEDGRIKLFVTSRGLNYRMNNRELFERGEYLPLKTAGENERHVVAFVRRLGDRTAIVIATRFFSRLIDDSRAPVGAEAWGDTAVALNEELTGHYRDIFTGERVCAQRHGLPLAEACAHLPLALLDRV